MGADADDGYVAHQALAPFALLAGNVFVGQLVLVLRRIGERLDDQPHLHPVLKHAALDRIFRANQREHARAFRQIDEGLE